ncbi:MAG: hypothetical protein K8S00_13595 [Bacteroidales bacterium]|nr:hypothetical protein [Bacteroidales bacterium]
MTKVLKFVIFSAILFLISCEKPNPLNCEDYDFSDCYLEEPEWDFIHIKVTINEENPYVPIIIYKGNFEDNNVDWTDTAWSSDYSIDVQLNQYYSVTAEYKVNSQKILAVDGSDVRKVKTTVCDEKCWYIKGDNFDVELKFD